MFIEIELDEATGALKWWHDWQTEAKLDGEARIAWLSLHNRYKAIQAAQRAQAKPPTTRPLDDSAPQLKKVV